VFTFLAYPVCDLGTMSNGRCLLLKCILRRTGWRHSALAVHFMLMMLTHNNWQRNKLLPIALFSAGVGRSGTLIAVDELLCQAAETQSIDVLKCIENLRLQRMYMVQTLVSRAALCG